MKTLILMTAANHTGILVAQLALTVIVAGLLGMLIYLVYDKYKPTPEEREERRRKREEEDQAYAARRQEYYKKLAEAEALEKAEREAADAGSANVPARSGGVGGGLVKAGAILILLGFVLAILLGAGVIECFLMACGIVALVVGACLPPPQVAGQAGSLNQSAPQAEDAESKIGRAA